MQKEYGQWLGAANEILDKFKPISEMGEKITSKDLRRAIKQMGTAKKGLYKKTIEQKLTETIQTMNDRGFDYLDRSNILPFLNMMDSLHGSALEGIYGSGWVETEIKRRLKDKKNPISMKDLQANLESWIERAENKQFKKKNRPMLNIRKKFNPLPGSGSNDY